MFYKKVFLKISQNSQLNTCGRFSFLIKLQFTFFTEHLGMTASESKAIITPIMKKRRRREKRKNQSDK